MAKGATKPMYKRMIAVAILIVFGGFSVLLVNLFRLQILNYEVYQAKAIEQQTRDITISAKRGTIYDRNKKALATSASAYLVYISPAAIKTDKEKETIISGLSEILGTTDEEKATYREKITAICNKSTYYEIVVRRIEDTVKDKVLEFVEENKLASKVNIAEDPKRYYPLSNFASHVIGFTGTDNQGLAGIEQYYDSYLKGDSGRIITATTALGVEMDFDNKMYIEPQDGDSIVLTIDEVIQHFLEKTLAAAVKDYNVEKRGAGIIMNAKTGEILAMSVQPDFDLNNPFELNDDSVKESLTSLTGDALRDARNTALNEMWKNKCVTDQYIPGSVYKIITSSIGLEEGVVDFNTTYTCTGGIKVDGWPKLIRCDKRAGHGLQTFVQGFQNSCNPFFITVGLKIGALASYNYATAYGLRAKTNVDLPGEGLGIFYNSDMSLVDLATLSFGQNIKVTPIQMITAVAAAVNGGKLLKPHIVKEIIDAKGNTVESFSTEVIRQVISEETSAQMRTLLEAVVQNGSGRNSAIAGYRIGGKTGTSEKTDERNDEGVADKRLISFVSVAPIDDPEIVMLLILDEPTISTRVSGGLQVAPMSRQILSDVLPYLGIEPALTIEELLSSEVTVPNIVGKTTEEAKATLKSSKLSIIIKGGDGVITKQLPIAGQKMPVDGEVIAYTNDQSPPETATVPNIKGLTASKANQLLINAGLSAKFTTTGGTGNFVVYSCSPAVGESVSTGTVVTVDMRVNAEEITN